MPTSLPTPCPVIPVLTPAHRPSPHPGLQLGRNLLVLWHLLSLDAPSVAAVWTLFVASVAHLRLPLRVPVAMFATVWMLYAADHLMERRILATTDVNDRSTAGDISLPEALGLEARHFFHHRHRRPLIAGILLCALLLAVLVPQLDPAAIRLDLVLGSLLFGYFVLIHATASAHRLPKEISVGLFFAAAVFIPTVARAPHLRLTFLPVAVLFAILCSLNCLFIYRWEHATDGTASPSSPGLSQPHRLTRGALRFLSPTAVFLVAASLALAAATHHRTPCPIAFSALLLLCLHRSRTRLAPLTLRAAADLVLLTPLPFLLLRQAR